MNLVLNLRAWPDVSDIFNVGFDGCSIGRVWLARDRTDTAMPWEWLISIPMTLPDSSKGNAESLSAAVRALAFAWGQIVATTPAARLESALALLRTAGGAVLANDETDPELKPIELGTQVRPMHEVEIKTPSH